MKREEKKLVSKAVDETMTTIYNEYKDFINDGMGDGKGTALDNFSKILDKLGTKLKNKIYEAFL